MDKDEGQGRRQGKTKNTMKRDSNKWGRGMIDKDMGWGTWEEDEYKDDEDGWGQGAWTRIGEEEEDKDKGHQQGRTKDDNDARQGTRVSMRTMRMRDNNEGQWWVWGQPGWGTMTRENEKNNKDKVCVYISF
jgi:hypothetical protein